MSKRTKKFEGVQVSNGTQFFASAGRWATERLKAAALSGKGLSASALRTLDTLRHEEWKYFDDILVKEAQIRLRGVADLKAAGLTVGVPNSLGKTFYNYERLTDMDDASAQVSLDGLSKSNNDVQEFDLKTLPLPITHKDFFIDLRKLAASRERGDALDTIQVATAGRKVAETAEAMLFNGGKTFGGATIYGYTNFPSRVTSDFDGSKNWGDATKAGSSYLTDVITAVTAMAAKRQFGPFVVYVPTDAGIQLSRDYNAGTANIQTIRQRLLEVEQVQDIRTVDTLASGNVVFVQMTSDTVVWVEGEPLQTVQWDEAAGFRINFKAFQIEVPLLRADAQGRTGIYHFDDNA